MRSQLFDLRCVMQSYGLLFLLRVPDSYTSDFAGSAIMRRMEWHQGPIEDLPLTFDGLPDVFLKGGAYSTA